MLNLFRARRNERRDTLRAAELVVGYIVTGLVPRKWDRRISEALTWIILRSRPGRIERFSTKMAKSLRSVPVHPNELVAIAKDHYALEVESRWGRIRGTHSGGWTPEIRIDGLEELRKSQGQGYGTILWRMSFCSTPIVKIGMWKAGIPLVHLSKEEHGRRSDVWIARKVLRPLYRRAEDRYLAERVVIPWNGSPVGAMRTLLERLQHANAVVSIFGDLSGNQGVRTTFLDGHAEFAIGAPSLAARVGSTLLPVFVIREGTAQYRIVIDRPIELGSHPERTENIRAAVSEFSLRMQKAIAKHPASWADWGRFWSRTPAYPDAPEASTRAARWPAGHRPKT